MNRFQAMAQIMSLLNQDELLEPRSPVYKLLRRIISEKIDRLGPDAALAHVKDAKAEWLGKIKILCMWHKSTRKKKPPDFW